MTQELWSKLNNKESIFLIAGPCVIENKELLEEVSETLLQIQDKHHIPIILKSSYTKANRSRIDSFTGIGDQKALGYLHDVAQLYKLPCVTDIHTDEEVAMAAEFVDVLQIPAFLCRQTSLLIAAANTGKIINVKKGQFLSPEAMIHAKTKIIESGNEQVMLTERGVTFGYQDLVVDMRAIPIMQGFDVPVIMDVTHSLQKPNQAAGVTGGQPEYIDTIASAAVAAGVDGLFIETHPDPSKALSDGANMLNLSNLAQLIDKMVAIKKAIQL